MSTINPTKLQLVNTAEIMNLEYRTELIWNCGDPTVTLDSPCRKLHLEFQVYSKLGSSNILFPSVLKNKTQNKSKIPAQSKQLKVRIGQN